MLDLDAIEARAEAATPGDHWFADLEPEDQRCCAAFTSYEVWAAQDPDEESNNGVVTEFGCKKVDAEFIAHARTDVPALVAELRAAREVVEAAAQRIGGSHAMVCDAYALGPGTTCDCGRDDLAAALAAYRAVVGEA
jgi:hypothetical protein